MKKANFLLIFKKKGRKLFVKYQPMSLTSNITKIFFLIETNLVSYIGDNNLLRGFCKIEFCLT